MDHDLARRSHEVFSQALDLAEPQRHTYIDSACAGDTALRRAVDRLVRAIEDSATFLNAPALSGSPRATARSASPATPRDRIGRYRILRVIGAGGMATVYEAVQTHPERRVALKVMRDGISGASSLARFRFETEVLARLHHPGIAQIFEAGTHDEPDGRCTPYFAMELVEGAQTITAHAESSRLSLRDRLACFALACDAVHHGHLLGVIHRDLKPGNVLVGADDRPKIIDFGVARSADPAQTRITMQADTGHLLGTLNSMSPEQCAGDAASLDVRTDVYSLGVILYELCCHRLPHDLSAVPLTEAIRIVQRDDPRRPSLIDPALRGDLEAVILKALEKSPDRRYASAADLAADIRHLLSNEPVAARPATSLYLLAKFARRHRALVASAAAILLTLVAGIAATSWMAYQANAARAAAERRQRDLERVAAFQDAAISDIDVLRMGANLRSSLEGRDLDAVDFTDVARTALDTTLMDPTIAAIGSQFEGQPEIAALLYSSVGRTAASLGLLERAAAANREALRVRTETLGEDHPDTIEALHDLGASLARLSQREEAEQCFRTAIAARTSAFGPDDPRTLTTEYLLGNLLQDMGRIDDAGPVVRRVLDTRRRILGDAHIDTIRSAHAMANLLRAQSRIDDAESAYRSALDAARASLGDGDTETQKILTNLSTLLQVKGEFGEAESLQRELIDIRTRTLGNDHPETLLSLSVLASNLQAQNRFDEAQVVLLDLLERRERVLGPLHASTLHTVSALGGALRQSGKVAESVPYYQRALDGRRRTLGDDHPDTLQSIHNMSGLMYSLDRYAEAESLEREAIERAPRTLPEDHWFFGVFKGHLADVLVAENRFAEAEPELLDAHRIFAKRFGDAHFRTRGAAKALADFYDAWHSADPAADHTADADRWRAAAADPDAPSPDAPSPNP